MISCAVRGDTPDRASNVAVVWRMECQSINADGSLQKKKAEICKKLDIEESRLNQVDVQLGTAKQFLETKSLVATLAAKLPADSDAPF